MIEPPDRQRPIGFWLKLVDGLIEASFDEVLVAADVSRRHWQVLNLLAAGGGATLADLDASVAPFLSAAEPTVLPVVADLRTRGWLEHGPDALLSGALLPSEALRLSEAGRHAHARLHDAVAASRQRVTAGLTAEQYRATVDVLQQMAVNLGWAPS